jgi:hypothetical protein
LGGNKFLCSGFKVGNLFGEIMVYMVYTPLGEGARTKAGFLCPGPKEKPFVSLPQP